LRRRWRRRRWRWRWRRLWRRLSRSGWAWWWQGGVGHAFHLQRRNGLHYLRVEGIRRLKQDEQLTVVHLKQHACYFARQVRLNGLDQREEPFAKQPFLLLGWCRCKRRSVDLLRCSVDRQWWRSAVAARRSCETATTDTAATTATAATAARAAA